MPGGVLYHVFAYGEVSLVLPRKGKKTAHPFKEWANMNIEMQLSSYFLGL